MNTRRTFNRPLARANMYRFASKYGTPEMWDHVPPRVFLPLPRFAAAAAANTPKLEAELAGLDFDAPCNVGPDGLVVKSFEQCEYPAEYNVGIHRCSNGENGFTPIVLCAHHVAYVAEALQGLLEAGNGQLACGTKADSVFEIMTVEKIRRQS